MMQLKSKIIQQNRKIFEDPKLLNELVEKLWNDQPTFPEILVRKLSYLKLLKTVPFHYLVPHPDMLQEESIKFFYLDYNWVNALVDGAYSIGRYTSKIQEDSANHHVSVALDKIHLPAMHQCSLKSAHQHRDYLFEKQDGFLQVTSKRESNGDNPTIISGFLLRSKAVSHWKNLEVTAFPTKGDLPGVEGKQQKISVKTTKAGEIENTSVQTNQIFRFERITSEILLCLFVDDFYRVDIHQPSQGIHFGFDRGTNAPFVKNTLRDKNAKAIDLKGPLPVEFKNQDLQVVDMATLSKNLGKKLNDKGQAPDYYDESTHPYLLSSDFAFQMVEGVGMVQFINNNNKA